MACQAAGSAWYRALPRWMYPISQPEYSYTGSPLVVEASKRARQLVDGAQPLIDPKDMKPLKIAVEEINRGLLTYQRDPDLED